MLFDPNDRVGIFLVGSRDTSNQFATQNIPGFEHITQWMEFKQPLLTDMERLSELSDVSSASIHPHPASAVHLGLDVLINADVGRARPDRSIVIIAPFSNEDERAISRENVARVRDDVVSAQLKGKPVSIAVRWLGTGDNAKEALQALRTCVQESKSPSETDSSVKAEAEARVSDADWELWQHIGLQRAQLGQVLAYPCGEGVLDAAALCGAQNVSLLEEEAERSTHALQYRKASPVANDMPMHVNDIVLSTSLFASVSEAKIKMTRCAVDGGAVQLESVLVGGEAGQEQEVPEEDRTRAIEYGGTLVEHARAREGEERGIWVLSAVPRVGMRAELGLGASEVLAGSKKSTKDAALA